MIKLVSEKLPSRTLYVDYDTTKNLCIVKSTYHNTSNDNSNQTLKRSEYLLTSHIVLSQNKCINDGKELLKIFKDKKQSENEYLPNLTTKLFEFNKENLTIENFTNHYENSNILNLWERHDHETLTKYKYEDEILNEIKSEGMSYEKFGLKIVMEKIYLYPDVRLLFNEPILNEYDSTSRTNPNDKILYDFINKIKKHNNYS